MKSIINLKGMHCASCRVLIEDICSDIPGISVCDVDVEKGMLTLEHDTNESLEKVVADIRNVSTYTIEHIETIT